MAATTHPPDATGPGPAPAGPGLLRRFDRLERLLHWVNAAMFAILILTGAALYLEPIGALVGRRALVEDIHVYTGVALPLPLILAISGSWGRALRQDLGRFNRWSKTDRIWLRSLFQSAPARRREMSRLQVGKFNAGQKLNAAFIAGGGLVMLGTGLIMRWYHPWPLAWRTGATFVHDWLALAIGFVIIGHIGMALRDPDALRSIVVGTISRAWAKQHAPAWLAGRDEPDPGPDAEPPRRARPLSPFSRYK
jgi:formate dehydrogenase subunit gamma